MLEVGGFFQLAFQPQRGCHTIMPAKRKAAPKKKAAKRPAKRKAAPKKKAAKRPAKRKAAKKRK